MSKNPGTAAVLSFLIPGVGQIYNGQFLWALFWLIVTPGMWVGTGGLLGWVCHFLAAWLAYRAAKRIDSCSKSFDKREREEIASAL
ncbi:MAG: hypothetical protein HY791_28740 [Deltaproteobacteria bacterium]|nr:hypothetical protein [Deltaproteobacteria bacterium]